MNIEMDKMGLRHYQAPASSFNHQLTMPVSGRRNCHHVWVKVYDHNIDLSFKNVK